jgi:hypothetical protein
LPFTENSEKIYGLDFSVENTILKKILQGAPEFFLQKIFSDPWLQGDFPTVWAEKNYMSRTPFYCQIVFTEFYIIW